MNEADELREARDVIEQHRQALLGLEAEDAGLSDRWDELTIFLRETADPEYRAMCCSVAGPLREVVRRRKVSIAAAERLIREMERT